MMRILFLCLALFLLSFFSFSCASSPLDKLRLSTVNGGIKTSTDMDCGGVSVCGILVIETGKGPGNYNHPNPSVHGLWPEVSPYGNSQCIAPADTTTPSSLYPCYDDLTFQNHEWTKHGMCSGTQSADDFFGQVCSLSANPIAIVSQNNDSLDSAQSALQSAGYEVFNVDNNDMQLELSACLNQSTGKWILTGVANFTDACGASKMVEETA